MQQSISGRRGLRPVTAGPTSAGTTAYDDRRGYNDACDDDGVRRPPGLRRRARRPGLRREGWRRTGRRGGRRRLRVDSGRAVDEGRQSCRRRAPTQGGRPRAGGEAIVDGVRTGRQRRAGFGLGSGKAAIDGGLLAGGLSTEGRRRKASGEAAIDGGRTGRRRRNGGGRGGGGAAVY